MAYQIPFKFFTPHLQSCNGKLLCPGKLTHSGGRSSCLLQRHSLHLHTSASPTCPSPAPLHCSPLAPVLSWRCKRQQSNSGWPVGATEPAGSGDIGVGTQLGTARFQGAHLRLQAPLSTSQQASVRGSMQPAGQQLYLGLNSLPPGLTSSQS